MTNYSDDPAVRWAGLLDGLLGARRDAVISALRHSTKSGWPPSEQAVRTLVDYAQGLITAQEYAVQILVDLGIAAPVRAERATPAPAAGSDTTESPTRLDHRLGAELLDEPASLAPTPVVTPVPQPVAPRLSREEAVQAYVSGRIPVEEFLRIARGA